MNWKAGFGTLLLILATVAYGADELADGFRSPPESARPVTFWQWMNGCVSKEGITSDLESFKRGGWAACSSFSSAAARRI